jgi:hypothetical protein
LSDALCLGAVLLNFAPFTPGLNLGFYPGNRQNPRAEISGHAV